MNELVRIAAESVGAKVCVAVEKCPDGMYNKSFVLTMDDGQEIIAKVPNPNAGVSYFTTASEVATMDFFGGLYYTKDLANMPQKNHLYSDNKGNQIWNRQFAIGPATGRDWFDCGRVHLGCDRGPCAPACPTSGSSANCIAGLSVYDYYKAIGLREKLAISTLTKLPKQTVMVCGPGLYQPERRKKLSAAEGYLQVFDALLPTEIKSITTPCLWHDDLHDENIFVDPNDPSKVVGIIDWQSVNLLPLLDHNPDPAFIVYRGPEPESLDRPELEDTEGLSEMGKAEAIRKYYEKALFIASRKIALKKTPAAYDAIEYQKTESFDLLVLARRLLEFGEAHFHALTVSLRDVWHDLPANNGLKPPRRFPIVFDDQRLAEIEEDGEKAMCGMQIMNDFKARLGPLWPDKDAVEHGQYKAAKAALRALKEEVVEEFGKTEEDKAELARQWPFDN
ncbi:hypothetical protein PRK78_007056 [Emydomyces testavorans]|uniref:Aminoglycoside phosphotransferase domain-containing protein n=1 Tax=Emydomyces testavorans TaxID=2070801 RepID=A0AAF0DRC8_9EURO|nr:hypothetical protein PRK78_007056 [Emydomyces testavorans]